MFDIGWSELLVIAVVAIIVVGVGRAFALLVCHATGSLGTNLASRCCTGVGGGTMRWRGTRHANIYEDTQFASRVSVALPLDLSRDGHNRGRHGVSRSDRIE